MDAIIFAINALTPRRPAAGYTGYSAGRRWPDSERTRGVAQLVAVTIFRGRAAEQRDRGGGLRGRGLWLWNHLPSRAPG